MAESPQNIKNTYPIPAYNYRVTINNDGNSSVLGFSQVTGLNVEYQPVHYKHGLSFAMGAKIIPGMRQPIRVTLKKGVVKSGDYLSSWINSAYSGDYTGSKRDIVIDLCDETGIPVIRWKVRNALPIKMEAPSFDANSNEVAIESIELIAEEMEINYSP